jgi:hypothetical protein
MIVGTIRLILILRVFQTFRSMLPLRVGDGGQIGELVVEIVAFDGLEPPA